MSLIPLPPAWEHGDDERGGDVEYTPPRRDGLLVPAAYGPVLDTALDIADQPTAVLAALPAARDFTRERRARWHDQMAGAYRALAQQGYAAAPALMERHAAAAARLRDVREDDEKTGGPASSR